LAISLMSKPAPDQGAGMAATPAGLLVPFTRAAGDHVEPFTPSATVTVQGNATQVGPVSVAAYGFLRFIELQVSIGGGTNTVVGVLTPDAPWTVLNDITLMDVNGTPLFGPVAGYDLYLISKYGGYSSATSFDPKSYPDFVALTTAGVGAFALRIPVEICRRTALGSLGNQNQSTSYRLRYTIAAFTDVMTGSTFTVMPTVTVRPFLHAWSQPVDMDLFGHQNATVPPNHGTNQIWSKNVAPVVAGANTILNTRLGNYIRTQIFQFRTAAGVRSNAQFPTDISEWLDTRQLFDRSITIVRNNMHRQYGFLTSGLDATNGPDTGILVQSYADDLNGYAGSEYGDHYIATLGSTRHEWKFVSPAIGTMTILTNDVAPQGDIYAYEGQ
jgi:hypothetical protein